MWQENTMDIVDWKRCTSRLEHYTFYNTSSNVVSTWTSQSFCELASFSTLCFGQVPKARTPQAGMTLSMN